MIPKCPRCGVTGDPSDRFCARCGLPLRGSAAAPGRIADPAAQNLPEGLQPVEEAAQLGFAVESSLGGAALIGTEGMRVRVFNAGYPLRDVHLEFTGRDGANRVVARRSERLAELPRGEPVEFEVPSYDVSGPVERVSLKLVRAEFLPNG